MIYFSIVIKIDKLWKLNKILANACASNLEDHGESNGDNDGKRASREFGNRSRRSAACGTGPGGGRRFSTRCLSSRGN